MKAFPGQSGLQKIFLISILVQFCASAPTLLTPSQNSTTDLDVPNLSQETTDFDVKTTLSLPSPLPSILAPLEIDSLKELKDSQHQNRIIATKPPTIQQKKKFISKNRNSKKLKEKNAKQFVTTKLPIITTPTTTAATSTVSFLNLSETNEKFTVTTEHEFPTTTIAAVITPSTPFATTATTAAAATFPLSAATTSKSTAITGSTILNDFGNIDSSLISTPLSSTTKLATTSTSPPFEITSTTLQAVTLNIETSSRASTLQLPSQASTTLSSSSSLMTSSPVIERNNDSIIINSEKSQQKNSLENSEIIVNNNRTDYNNSKGHSSSSSIGHDGVKITKKKQLLQKHFNGNVAGVTMRMFPKSNNDNVVTTTTGASITNGAINDSDAIDDHYHHHHKSDNFNNEKEIKIEKTEIEEIKNKSVENKSSQTIITTTEMSILKENQSNEMNKKSTTEGTIEKTMTTTTEISYETMNSMILDTDLISHRPEINEEITTMDAILPTDIQTTMSPSVVITSTASSGESEFIKHKMFENSLISKMEWIPIENIKHSTATVTLNTESFDQKTTENNKLETLEPTTILPHHLTTDITDTSTSTTSVQSEILPSTEIQKSFVHTTMDRSETDQKSLEIELIETSTISSIGMKSKSFIPEFFEIESDGGKQQKDNNNNNDKESDSLSAIEIQINVSEGFGNESENLEFSFRQSDSQKSKDTEHNLPLELEEIGEITIHKRPNLISPKPTVQPATTEVNRSIKLMEPTEEVLQVEITAIDNDSSNNNRNKSLTPGDNRNENVNDKQSEAFNETPKFTVHNEQTAQSELHDNNDDFFVPDLKVDDVNDNSKSLENPIRDAIDRDSDTIFYISNTEVKVVESKPQLNSSSVTNENAQESDRMKLESQFFPTIYEEDVLIDMPGNQQKTTVEQQDLHKQFGEDIILSPMKNNFNKIILNSAEKQYPSAAQALPDVSYVGETFIEIEESTSPPGTLKNNSLDVQKLKTSTKKDTDLPLDIIDTATMNSEGALLSDVIIQPANIPAEMSIGVPVIGELPPQIELKEIDFLPDGKVNSGDKIIEGSSAIQYGGDLIADDVEMNVNRNRYIFDSGYPLDDEKISKVGRVKNGGGMEISDNMDDDMGGEDDSMVTQQQQQQQQIIMHAVSNLQREQFIADLPLANWENFKEIPQKRSNDNSTKILPNFNATNSINNSTNFSNLTTNGNTTELLGNATAYSVLEEIENAEFNFTDMQTLLIACFATLVPLILSLLLAFGLRYLWKKYRQDHDEGSGLVGDSSTDPLAAKAISQDELQTTESGYTLNRSNDTLESNTDMAGGGINGIVDGLCVGGGGGGGGSGLNNSAINTNCLGIVGSRNDANSNQTNGIIIGNMPINTGSGANGSVTTMTLKNNHLIVETEERDDISRDARETKMHYTSSEKDGVFVVEVARGADSTGVPGSPHKDICDHQKSGNNDFAAIDVSGNEKTQPISDDCGNRAEEVQIHQPPRADDQEALIDDSLESPDNLQKHQIYNLGNSNTGLSQSDLSTSSDDSNKAYSYGKQELYTIQTNGYSPPSPQPKSLVLQSDAIENDNNDNKHQTETKPVITAALLKQDTINDIISIGNTKKGNTKIENNENGQHPINGTNALNEIEDFNDEELNSFLPPPQFLNDNNNVISNADIDDDDSGEAITRFDQPEEITTNYENGNANGTDMIETNDKENLINNSSSNGGENGYDSIISLPEPPSNEEIKQMNDIILLENSQLDSLPPPPPPLLSTTDYQTPTTITTTINNNNNGNGNIRPIPEEGEFDGVCGGGGGGGGGVGFSVDNDSCNGGASGKNMFNISTSNGEHLMTDEQHGITKVSNGGGTIVAAAVTEVAVSGSS